MELSPGLIGTLLVVAILLSGGALIAGVMAVQAQRKVTRTYGRFARGRREDVVTLLEMHMDEVKQLQRMVRAQQAYAKQLRGVLSRSLSRIGTVRYDAFDDMGGRLSFSIALLDEHGDGSVITAMNGRVQTRTYAKPVTGGSSTHNLSEEEVQAIAQAMEGGARRAAEGGAATPDADEPPNDRAVESGALASEPAPGAAAVGEATPAVDADPAGASSGAGVDDAAPARLRGAGLTPRPRQPVVPVDYDPGARPRTTRPARQPDGDGPPAAEVRPPSGVTVDRAGRSGQAGA